MGRFGIYIASLLICVGGVVAIGAQLATETEPECPDMTLDELAMGRSRMGFPSQDLAPSRELPDCLEYDFLGSLAFRETDLSPEDVVEMAAAAGWFEVEGNSISQTCFRRDRDGWERMELTMPATTDIVSELSVLFNSTGACSRVVESQ